MRVAAIPHQKIKVDCQVEAVPKVNRFYWTYNTSRNVIRVQGSKMENKGDISTLYFEVPPYENEIPSLSCWTNNDLGPQLVPCLFILVPASEYYKAFLDRLIIIYMYQVNEYCKLSG